MTEKIECGHVGVGMARRICLSCHSPAEKAITEAMQVVESAGCDTRLTEAVTLLGHARNKVADFVDLIPAPDAVVPAYRQEALSVTDMVRGLVRCAEIKERDEKNRDSKLWDGESRAALEAARARGWGKNAIGTLGETVEPGKKAEFRRELEALINKHSLEGGSNTPDFLLAEYLTSCLESFEKAVKAREGWYGWKLSPGKLPAAIVILLCFLLTACSSSELRRFEPTNLFADFRPSELLTDKTYKRLVFEVVQVEGCTLWPGDLTYLVELAKRYCKKPNGVEVTWAPTLPVSAVRTQKWSSDDLEKFCNKWSVEQTYDSTLVIHILSVPGRDQDEPDFAAGYAFAHDGLVLYPLVLRAGRSPPSSLLTHELGHLLGLVSSGTPAIAKHVDKDGEHCKLQGCAMYFAAPVTSSPDFCQDCQADLKAMR